MSASGTEELSYISRTNRALARLHFGERLDGSNIFSETNLDLICQSVHEDPSTFPKKPTYTFGDQVDNHPEYVTDICKKILAQQGPLSKEEFLASFLEGVGSEDVDQRFKFSNDVEQMDEQPRKEVFNYLQSLCVQYQIPFDDVSVMFGIYTLQCAEQSGIIKVGDNFNCSLVNN